MKLPYVMGLEVLSWIRSQVGTALPVIMFSASAEEADIATSYRLGANAFLIKPSEASKLDGMVKAIKDFWLTNNTLPREALPAGRMEGMVSFGSLRGLGGPLTATAIEETAGNIGARR